MSRRLHHLLRDAAARHPARVAVLQPGHDPVTYEELDALSEALAGALLARGIRPGDRVGIWADKSAGVVAAMQAALRVGAAYVPIDPSSPRERVRLVIDDAALSVLVTTEARLGALEEDHGPPRPAGDQEPPRPAGDQEPPRPTTDRGPPRPAVLLLDVPASWPRTPSPSRPWPESTEHDLAYILYTSGSTGRPKGVCLSHRNALAFVDWAVDEMRPSEEDRLANHAPFHFDLSVLDLYVAMAVGASIVLIPQTLAYAPRRLVELVEAQRVTLWYSVPSVLVMMLDQGDLAEVAPRLSLRVVNFAGEPFPLKHLRRLRACLPAARLLNLYGPTETNVCTFHEVHALDPDRTAPVPIGAACSGARVWAERGDGEAARPGQEGELMVEGPTLMLGYWGHPPHGARPYATGDLVRVEDDQVFTYLGRRDHMVKVRGHRVELGEIEAILLLDPGVFEVAVVVEGAHLEARLVAFVVPPARAAAADLARAQGPLRPAPAPRDDRRPGPLARRAAAERERQGRPGSIDERERLPGRRPALAEGLRRRLGASAPPFTPAPRGAMNDTIDALVTYIGREFLHGQRDGLDAGTPLLEWNVLDSLSMMSLIAFIEAQWGVAIPDDHVLPENFQDIRSIARLIHRLGVAAAG
ncbi:MAG: amino acid adenylation domain-containing protein [Nannocystaceae bacterium]